MSTVREASHAGSWYTANGPRLDSSLTDWLAAVNPAQIPAPDKVAEPEPSSSSSSAAEELELELTLPIRGCKAIIGPHAGYSYSGPAAAWAYKCIDTTDIKRVFVLGPSHHVYLNGCALSKCDEYETPIGNLPLDKDTIDELRRSGEFSDMSLQTDEDEHSIEMHLPYIRKVFQGQDIKLVPILVGSISADKEAHFGKFLAPYLADPSTIFVVSSDFCHWGSRFSYTYYRPSSSSTSHSLSSNSKPDASTPIHTSIRNLDNEGMAAITHPHLVSPPGGATSGGDSAAQKGPKSTKSAKDAQMEFRKYLKSTQNTVCGRHPIGVLLGALAELERGGRKSETRFVRYEQSSQCITPRDSSVSYASAFVRFRD